MPFDAEVWRVLISSPSDTTAAREAVLEAIIEWNDLNAEGLGVVLLPVMWEMSATPEMGPPQEVINRQIVDSADVLVGTFWTRIGTPTTGGQSGTVEEIERVASREAPVLLYFSNQPAAPGTMDPKQLEALLAFRSTMNTRGLFNEYETLPDLKAKVQRALTRVVRGRHGRGEEGGSAGTPPTDQPGGPGDGGLGSELERVLDRYKAEVRSLIGRHEAQWRSAVGGDDLDALHREMAALGRELSQLLGAIAAISESGLRSQLYADLRALAHRAGETSRMEVFMDGGMSWNALVNSGSSLLDDLGAVAVADWVDLVNRPAAA